jgi:hypothetical protein
VGGSEFGLKVPGLGLRVWVSGSRVQGYIGGGGGGLLGYLAHIPPPPPSGPYSKTMPRALWGS